MPEFSDRELFNAQIAGGIAAVISLMMGVTGKIMLANKSGVPEYDLCLKNSGWTLLLVSIIWIALASWHRHLRN